ncbi:hypothetical protein AB6N23_17555 [Cellulomonas sp. 179-A 9B4 NHS]|uniref:hypothetical protein n=1 Tax=Cellulomonas sp. 179-A 9B4 NHS TaxID=3142379 RepID=UPI0039A23082
MAGGDRAPRAADRHEPERVRVPEPEIPEDVTFAQLDREARGPLRTLSKDNAERVGRHLVMVGRLLDVDPERAYEHAAAAVRRAGRVDVVREAAGLAAYRTGRYAEALRELRTVRRLNGSSEHLAVMADAERGLGRPERAIALANEPEAEALPAATRVELAMVVSGARLDMGQAEAAVAALATDLVRGASGVLAVRVAQARAAALEAAGRHADAEAELAPYSERELEEAAGLVEVEEEVLVYDLEDDAPETADAPADPAEAEDAEAEVADAEDADADGADQGDGAEEDEAPDADDSGVEKATAAAAVADDAVADDAVADEAASDEAASDAGATDEAAAAGGAADDAADDGEAPDAGTTAGDRADDEEAR